jgi:hypothetical protein
MMTGNATAVASTHDEVGSAPPLETLYAAATVVATDAAATLAAEAVDWVLSCIGPHAKTHIEMPFGDRRLSSAAYALFALMVPHGAQSKPGSAHAALERVLSDRFGYPLRLEHNDDSSGICYAEVIVIPA